MKLKEFRKIIITEVPGPTLVLYRGDLITQLLPAGAHKKYRLLIPVYTGIYLYHSYIPFTSISKDFLSGLGGTNGLLIISNKSLSVLGESID